MKYAFRNNHLLRQLVFEFVLVFEFQERSWQTIVNQVAIIGVIVPMRIVVVANILDQGRCCVVVVGLCYRLLCLVVIPFLVPRLFSLVTKRQ